MSVDSVSSSDIGGAVVTTGLVFLFFWTLIGQYVYREAARGNRSSPKRRGLYWGVRGVRGALTYLGTSRERERTRWAWMEFSALLILFWAGDALINQDLPGWYAWAGFYSALFILYWQFDLEMPNE
jgi:hypothetical protein